MAPPGTLRTRPAAPQLTPSPWRRLQRIATTMWLSPRAIWAGWGLTRLVLFLGVVLGHAYCDPQFYNYAGKLAAGQLPFRDYPVEYPPLALVLILLPALPLLPFGQIAPRPDPAFEHVTHLPQPDPLRYGAYATSFAVEMLLVDALTLWLVLWLAPRFLPRGARATSAAWVYLLATYACGALLQKFDLAAGACVLLALGLLVAGSPRGAWAALAVATLIKGYPALLAPLFVAYALCSVPTLAAHASSPLTQSPEPHWSRLPLLVDLRAALTRTERSLVACAAATPCGIGCLRAGQSWQGSCQRSRWADRKGCCMR